MTFKPMLAEDVVTYDQLRYPLYGSFKVDGVRAVMPADRLKPRSLKEFGNRWTVDRISEFSQELAFFDGELVLGKDPAAPNLCRLTTSALSTHEGQPDIHWWLFDIAPSPLIKDLVTMTFSDRVALLKRRHKALPAKVRAFVHLLEQRLLRTPGEAEAMEHEALSRGYEGLVLKDPNGIYKFGRSTLRSQQFLRAKRFADAEVRIVGFVERMKNNNVATTNALGHTTRSSHKANKAAAGTLGTIVGEVLTGPFKGVTVEIGTGFDAATAAWIWANRAKLVGEIGKFSYFPIGCKDKPRFPVWQGFRAAFDMSN
jgi:DNA ligase-1